MSKIDVWGWESGRPYAHKEQPGEYKYKSTYLGVKELAGRRLPPQLGVDLDLARAEAVPIHVSNLVEQYVALLEEKHPLALDMAVLGFIANQAMPRELWHSHPAFIKKVAEDKRGMLEIGTHKNNLAQHGIALLEQDLVARPEKYLTNDTYGRDHYLQDLANFDRMLDRPSPSGRGFRVSSSGKVTPV